MAEVDFSNAILTPYEYQPSDVVYMSIYTTSTSSVAKIVNSSGTEITSAHTENLITREVDKFVVNHSGTFNASGTVFYVMADNKIHWRVSNISFQSGDTFNFSVSVKIAGA